ncbi:MAG: resolvase [Methanobacterium sp.]|nr:resolvase [Methanobacterium sp.]
MDKEIYVNKPLSSQKIMEILDSNPELEKIKCPSSIYLRISPKYLEALSKLGVDVEAVSYKGRPKKYDDADIAKISILQKQGLTFQEISDELSIPLKTIYYLNKTPLKKGRKSKYSSETIQKIKDLSDNGLSALEISKNLNIPLRTVYSLLKSE